MAIRARSTSNAVADPVRANEVSVICGVSEGAEAVSPEVGDEAAPAGTDTTPVGTGVLTDCGVSPGVVRASVGTTGGGLTAG